MKIPKVDKPDIDLNSPAKIVRFTLDLDTAQHSFLKLFSIENGTKSSVVMRTLLYHLETDPALQADILELIFSSEE